MKNHLVNKSVGDQNHLHDRKHHYQPSSSIQLHDRTDVENVKIFAHAVCREYLGGAWKNIEHDDLIVERIQGGLTNYLYKCEIKDEKFQKVKDEPIRILLRLYGEDHHKHSWFLLKDIITCTIFSDNCLGPKLYGVFPNGRLEEFINTPTMSQNEMYDPELSRNIARAMAKFHTSEMPFIKEPQWLFESTNKYIKQANEVSFTNDKDIKRFSKILSFNLENEYKKLKKVLKSINSPVVFCHNDLHVGNILKLENKLMVIDYEQGSYNYRGFDFGNHFCEWMFNNNYDKYPYFEYNYEKYPNRDQQINLINAYIDEYKNASNYLANDSDKENIKNFNMLDVEQIIKEGNSFALMAHIIWIYWAIGKAATSKIKFEYLKYALARCDAYFKLKNVFFPNGYEIDGNL